MPSMRPYILVIIFVCLSLHTFSQNEMETGCLKRIKEFSADKHFPKFTGLTSVSKDTIKFGSSVIVIRGSKPEVVNVFELGLVFPDLIYGASTMGNSYENRRTYSADTLSISDVTELHFPIQRPDTKSFSFLLWHRNIANPSLYLFELTSKEANFKTTLNVFIEKAKVTAFGFCSILM